MSAAEILQGLWETLLAASAASMLVLLLRTPLRRRFGARVAYGVWTLVPVAVVAVLVPAPIREVVIPAFSEPLAATARATVAQATPQPFDWTFPLLVLWLGGVCWSGLRTMRRQRDFMRSLGALTARRDGLWQADAIAGLPAIVGLRPRIVVPADFDARFAPGERALIVAHERLHARRGDLHANALAAGIACLYWFNPLLPLALERFRRDQELACDQAVLVRHPGSRRAYGEAMLKAGGVLVPAPLACQWLGHHPLKERIAMLASPLPTRRRQFAGVAVVLAVGVMLGYGAWAQQPEQLRAVQTASEGGAGRAAETTPQSVRKNSFGPDVSLAAAPRTRLEAALDIARQAGWTIDNPQAINASERFDKALPTMPALVALASATDLIPQVDGTRVRLLPNPPPLNSDRVVSSLDRALGSRTISITVTDVPARDIAQRVADEAGIRFAGAMPGGEKKITLEFQGVKASAVLAILAEETGNVVRIEQGALIFARGEG